MKKLVNSDGILVESAPLVARVQTTCAKRAQALQQEGRETEAAQLDNAVDTALSARVSVLVTAMPITYRPLSDTR
jgi:hypothetical protein